MPWRRTVPITFERVQLPEDRDRLVRLLTADEWPFHGRRVMDVDAVDSIEFSSSDVASYWIVDDDDTVGLLRLFDLDDIGHGAPLRAAPDRSQHPRRQHRDAAGADHCRFRPRRAPLRSSWPAQDGSWFDTMVYGILRTDLGV